jgi:phosphoglycerate kinase
MRFGIRTLEELEVAGRTVLLRVDINEPVDRGSGRLKDSTRIEAAAPTLRELLDRGARVAVLAHQGSDIEYKNYFTTTPHAKVLSELLGQEVGFIDDVCGPAARQAIRELKAGEALLLDNVRYLAEEQTLFELNLRLTHEQQAQTLLVRTLAPLADCYVCDAFAAAHRDQPSLCGFEQVLPSAMGRLFEREYCAISELMHSPARPCAFVLGGAKVGDAFQMLETVLQSGAADRVLTGGLVANILLWAKGMDIGEASRKVIAELGYDGLVEGAKGILSAHGERIALPVDVAYVEDGIRKECPVGGLPAPQAIADIGRETLARYRAELTEARTVFANGPMGIFERAESSLGTRGVWEALGETKAHTVIGGGDSLAAAKQFGVLEKMGTVCTGGGALIRFLTGEELPVVRALRHGSALPQKVR